MRANVARVFLVLFLLCAAPDVRGAHGRVAARALVEVARQVVRELPLPDVSERHVIECPVAMDRLDRINARRLEMCAVMTELVDGRWVMSLESLQNVDRGLWYLQRRCVEGDIVREPCTLMAKCVTALFVARAYIDCAVVIVQRSGDVPIRGNRLRFDGAGQALVR